MAMAALGVRSSVIGVLAGRADLMLMRMMTVR